MFDESIEAFGSLGPGDCMPRVTQKYAVTAAPNAKQTSPDMSTCDGGKGPGVTTAMCFARDEGKKKQKTAIA